MTGEVIVGIILGSVITLSAAAFMLALFKHYKAPPSWEQKEPYVSKYTCTSCTLKVNEESPLK